MEVFDSDVLEGSIYIYFLLTGDYFFFSDSLYLKMAMWLKPLKTASLKFYMKEAQ